MLSSLRKLELTDNAFTRSVAMIGRRSSIEVIGDILRMESASKTHIMYRVGMSYAQLSKYLDNLMDRGFLAWTDDTYPSGLYTITEEGRRLLESVERIEEML